MTVTDCGRGSFLSLKSAFELFSLQSWIPYNARDDGDGHVLYTDIRTAVINGSCLDTDNLLKKNEYRHIDK